MLGRVRQIVLCRGCADELVGADEVLDLAESEIGDERLALALDCAQHL
ncbi:MAG: hypothetical protein AAGI88_26095 [Pseudomonadota bacterium]